MLKLQPIDKLLEKKMIITFEVRVRENHCFPKAYVYYKKRLSIDKEEIK